MAGPLRLCWNLREEKSQRGRNDVADFVRYEQSPDDNITPWILWVLAVRVLIEMARDDASLFVADDFAERSWCDFR